MATQHDVPSRDFWTVTPFHFSTPDGWVAKQTVDHLAFMHVDGNTDINCAIGWKRVAGSMDLRRLIQINSLALKKRFPEAIISLSRYGRLRDRVAYMRVAEFDHPELGPYGQIYSAFFGPRFGSDRPVEFFELTGAFPAADNERMKEIIAIVESFQFRFADAKVSPLQAKGA
ncbi:MAG TPA: hypothetical protein DCR14_09880 [Acidimicrobiaceae bacterium]|nr:hypothetical protein [Acidimicrobiaceae bacterium]